MATESLQKLTRKARQDTFKLSFASFVKMFKFLNFLRFMNKQIVA